MLRNGDEYILQRAMCHKQTLGILGLAFAPEIYLPGVRYHGGRSIQRYQRRDLSHQLGWIATGVGQTVSAADAEQSHWAIPEWHVWTDTALYRTHKPSQGDYWFFAQSRVGRDGHSRHLPAQYL